MASPIDQYVSGLVASGVMRPYQQAWMRDALTNPRIAALGARQIGKGWTVALIALVLANGCVLPDGRVIPGHDVLVVSKDKRTAQNMIAMIAKHVTHIETMFGPVRDPRRGGVQEIVFAWGSKIVSLPGTPRAIQGFTGSVIVDELAASVHDPEELFAQGLSVASSQDYFRFVVLSNAGISGGFAHKFFQADGEWEDRRAQFKVSSTTIYDAYEGLLPDRFKGLQKSISPTMWSRFYENSFESSGAGILAARTLMPLVASAPKIGVTYLGVDPGFGNNPTGFVVVQVHGERGYATVLHSSWRFQKEIAGTADRIKQLMKHYSPRRTFIDKGFAGMAFEPYFENNQTVEFVSVNKYSKQADLQGMVDLIEGGKIRMLDQQEQSGNPEVLYRDLEQVIWDDAGDLDLGRTFVKPGDKMAGGYGAKVGREIHADSAAALSYLVSTITQGIAARGGGKVTVGRVQ